MGYTPLHMFDSARRLRENTKWRSGSNHDLYLIEKDRTTLSTGVDTDFQWILYPVTLRGRVQAI